LECRNFFLFLRFSCEIELILVKFLCDSCEIPTFQTGPERRLNVNLVSYASIGVIVSIYGPTILNLNIMGLPVSGVISATVSAFCRKMLYVSSPELSCRKPIGPSNGHVYG